MDTKTCGKLTATRGRACCVHFKCRKIIQTGENCSQRGVSLNLCKRDPVVVLAWSWLPSCGCGPAVETAADRPSRVITDSVDGNFRSRPEVA